MPSPVRWRSTRARAAPSAAARRLGVGQPSPGGGVGSALDQGETVGRRRGGGAQDLTDAAPEDRGLAQAAAPSSDTEKFEATALAGDQRDSAPCTCLSPASPRSWRMASM